MFGGLLSKEMIMTSQVCGCTCNGEQRCHFHSHRFSGHLQAAVHRHPAWGFDCQAGAWCNWYLGWWRIREVSKILTTDPKFDRRAAPGGKFGNHTG